MAVVLVLIALGMAECKGREPGLTGLCGECESSLDCGGVGSLCIVDNMTGDRFCGLDCSSALCPKDYECKRIVAGGVSAHQCVPMSGSCSSSTSPGDGDDGTSDLCQPCKEEEDCGGPEDICIVNKLSQTYFCGRDCSEKSCPTGYLCYELKHLGKTVYQCAPESGDCDDV